MLKEEKKKISESFVEERKNNFFRGRSYRRTVKVKWKDKDKWLVTDGFHFLKQTME